MKRLKLLDILLVACFLFLVNDRNNRLCYSIYRKMNMSLNPL